MTTTVTIKAVEWPVRITSLEVGHVEVIQIEPYAEREFHIWQGRDLIIHEMPTYQIVGEDNDAG